MEKKKSKIKGILKYLVKTVSLTLLILLIVIGLALLFVFVSAKIAKSQDAEPPVNLYTIISPSMTPNIQVYDVVVTIKTDISKLKVGDIISYYSDNPAVNGLTITHRITQISKVGDEFAFKTKGDANKYEDEWTVRGSDVVGKVNFKIPQLGRVQFFLGSKGGWLIAILIPALGIIAYDIYKIIKLILIKQKIVAFQKDGDTKSNVELTTTIVDSPKEEIINETPSEANTNTLDSVQSVTEIHDNPVPLEQEPVQNSEEHKEEIVNIDEDNIIKSFDEQIKIMDEWKDKIDSEDNKN